MRNKKIMTLLLAATVAITSVAPSIQVKAMEAPTMTPVEVTTGSAVSNVTPAPAPTEKVSTNGYLRKKNTTNKPSKSKKTTTKSTDNSAMAIYERHFGKNVIGVNDIDVNGNNGESWKTISKDIKPNCITLDEYGISIRLHVKNGTKVIVKLSDNKGKTRYTGKVKKGFCDIKLKQRTVAYIYKGCTDKVIKRKVFKNRKEEDKWVTNYKRKHSVDYSSCSLGYDNIKITVKGYGTYYFHGTAKQLALSDRGTKDRELFDNCDIENYPKEFENCMLCRYYFRPLK